MANFPFQPEEDRRTSARIGRRGCKATHRACTPPKSLEGFICARSRAGYETSNTGVSDGILARGSMHTQVLNYYTNMPHKRSIA